MRTPWFFHCHAGRNTQVGVYPTPVGVYVRSYADGAIEVKFYPLGYEFEGGRTRVVDTIGRYTDLNETAIDDAVAADLAGRR